MQTFKELPTTDAAECVKDIWQDSFGGLWMKSNEGDQVMVPYRLIQRFKDTVIKASKYIPVDKRVNT